MRLATLARKIGMNPTRLISILSERDLNLEGGSNSKLDEETVKMILAAYAPELLPEDDDDIPGDETEAESITHEEEPSNPVKKDWSDELELELKEPPQKDPNDKGDLTKEPNKGEGEEVEEIEVIKAPKIKLPGLKIKGKIDLPEPKKKSETTEGERAKPDLKKISTTREKKRFDQNRSKKQNKDYNPLEEARKRAAKEKELKKRQQARIRKEKRKERYEREIKAKLKVQNQNKVPEKQEAEPAVEIPQTEPPKNVFAKFLKWLNT